MSNFWSILFGWLPTSEIRLVFAGLLTLAIIFLVLRIIKLALDALPFL